MLRICICSSSPSHFSARLIRNISKLGAKKYFIDHQIANAIHLFIFISLKWTLTSGQKPVYTVKVLISEQIALAAVLYFGQVFALCRLINKSVLEQFLLIMCK